MTKMSVTNVVNKLVERSNTNTRRLRDLEQQMSVLNTRLDSVQQTRLDSAEQVSAQLLELSKKVQDHEKKLLEIQTTLKQAVNQLKKAVTENRIQGLEALIDAYNPLKSTFVTKQELERRLKKIKK